MSGGLPEGWRWATLGSLCSKPQYGWTTSASRSPDGLKLLRTSDISSGRVDWDTVPTCAHAPENVDKYLLAPGDIVVSRAGSVGVSFVVGDDCPPAVFASYLIRFRPLAEVTSAYLGLFLQSSPYWTAITDEVAGIALPNINATKLARIEVPVPPLPEQHRIVVAVADLLAQTNAARERLARVPGILKRFRQAVLAAACDGRLTEGWRDSGDDFEVGTREVSALDSAWEWDLPSGWSLTTVGDLTTLVTSGSRGWAAYYADEGPMFIRAQDIKTDRVETTEIAHVRPPSSAEGARTRVALGDLLITITGANVTKAARVDRALGEAYVSQHVALVRPAATGASPWLHLWTISPAHGRRQLQDAAYGAGKPGLNLDNIRDMVVAFPPISEQVEIVRRTNALLALATTVERRLTIATARAERVPQAILARAFAGELVATEAEVVAGRGYAT